MLLLEVLREALDEEVALLLGVLESELVALDLSLTLEEGKERLNIELVSFDILVVKVLNCLASALTSVVSVTFAIKADETELAVIALLVLLGVNEG